jgi:hypothetical protein
VTVPHKMVRLGWIAVLYEVVCEGVYDMGRCMVVVYICDVRVY